MPTRRQKNLIGELNELSELLRLDYWNIHRYERSERTIRLELIKRQVTIGAVVKEYTYVDELLNLALCDHFFGREKSHPRLWRTKRFQWFNYYLLEQLYLLQKLRYAREFLGIPRGIVRSIEDLNNLRNALAHAFFPENLKRYKPRYKGLDIFGVDGMNRFDADMADVGEFFIKKLFLRRRGYAQGTRSLPTTSRRARRKGVKDLATLREEGPEAQGHERKN
jgi:hypothetical protein